MNSLLPLRMDFFRHMIRCSQHIDCWEFDTEGNLLFTTAENPALLLSMMELDNCAEELKLYSRGNVRKPAIISNSYEMAWIATRTREDEENQSVHMIGPVFNYTQSSRNVEMELMSRGISSVYSHAFRKAMSCIPVIPLISWMRYGLMLQYAVTEEEMRPDDYLYITATVRTAQEAGDLPIIPEEAWIQEQNTMRMIEEGRVDYSDILAKSNSDADVTMSIAATDPSVRQRDGLIASITLCSRAAIRGGLDPTTAYIIGAQYMRSTEDAKTLSELAQIQATMYDDFIRRVHQIRMQSGISADIRAICNYIDMHLNEELTGKQLSQKAGYAENYFMQKFKKEMGIGPSAYVRQQRVARAKVLLRATTKSIQEISEELGFCNHSHFTDIFRQQTGITPTRYRDGEGDA